MVCSRSAERSLTGLATFEATGPNHVAFVPGIEELEALAAARIAVLELDRGELTALTEPMLIRSLRASPAGEFVDFEYADGCEAQNNGNDATPDGMRWRSAYVNVAAQTTGLRKRRRSTRSWAASSKAVTIVSGHWRSAASTATGTVSPPRWTVSRTSRGGPAITSWPLTYYSDALALCRKSGNTNDEAEILASLGDTYAALDRRTEARRSWCLAVDLLRAQAQEAGHLLRKIQLLERTSDRPVSDRPVLSHRLLDTERRWLADCRSPLRPLAHPGQSSTTRSAGPPPNPPADRFSLPGNAEKCPAVHATPVW